jgi:hypothetical protein
MDKGQSQVHIVRQSLLLLVFFGQSELKNKIVLLMLFVD